MKDNMVIKPIWFIPKEWEDFKNGMYESQTRKEIISLCEDLFKSPELFSKMKIVLTKWTKCAHSNLSYLRQNRKPWVGQVVCSYEHKATISEVSKAWTKITKEDRKYANKQADLAIEHWEENIYEKLSR